MRERRRTFPASAMPTEGDEHGAPSRSNQRSRCPDSLPAAACPPARFLDQRLQIRDPPLEIAIVLDLWPAGRRCDGQSDSIRMKL